MRPVLAVTATVAAMLVLAASALATHLPTTGTPIRLLNQAATPATFASKTPFFVRHGWACTPAERKLCLDPSTEFRLYVDGQRMPSALDLELNVTCSSGESTSDECVVKRNLTNFRSGLPAGPHAFREEWWQSGRLVVLREATIDFVG